MINNMRLMRPEERTLIKELSRFRQNKDVIYNCIKSLTNMDCTGIVMSVSNLSKEALTNLDVLMNMQSCFGQGDIEGTPIIGVLPMEVSDALNRDYTTVQAEFTNFIFKDPNFKMSSVKNLTDECFLLVYNIMGVAIYHNNCQAFIFYKDCINLKPFLMMLYKYGAVFTKVLSCNKTLAQYVYSDDHTLDTVSDEDNLSTTDITNILMFKDSVFRHSNEIIDEALYFGDYSPCRDWIMLKNNIDTRVTFYGHKLTMLFKDLPELVANAYIHDKMCVFYNTSNEFPSDNAVDTSCEDAIASLIDLVPDYISNDSRTFRKPMEIKLGNRHVGYADGNLSKERAVKKCLDAMNKLNISLSDVQVNMDMFSFPPKNGLMF